MIEKLKNKISELEEEKVKLRKTFDEYEFKNFLENYNKLQKIDGALEVLKDMLMVELINLN
jgi:hypothetical protein